MTTLISIIGTSVVLIPPRDANRVTDAYASAYEFLYELVNEFSYLSEDRANDLKELLDDWLPR